MLGLLKSDQYLLKIILKTGFDLTFDLVAQL